MNSTLSEQRDALERAIGVARSGLGVTQDPLRRRACELIRLGFLGFAAGAADRQAELDKLRRDDPENQPVG